MKQIYLLLLLLAPTCMLAQTKLALLPQSNDLSPVINRIKADPKIDADSAATVLSHWQHYPELKAKGINYLFYYNDERIGTIPLRVFIPNTYNNSKPNACVLVLHGAVGISHFTDIDTLGNTDEDILVDPLKTQGYIIIQPIADKAKGFTWAGRMQPRNQYQPNRAFELLSKIIAQLKQVLNIDDNRVFALGHSDGADGVIGMSVYAPNQFAGVVAYNTMFHNLFARDYFLRNIQNLPLYEAHSDKDKLRPIALNRQIVDSLKKYTHRLTYKEYAGYEHYDKHLSIDEPLADAYMKKLVRNPFPADIYWETIQGSPYNTINWLSITGTDTTMASAAWHKPFDVNYKYFMEREQRWFETKIYDPLKSAAIKANYKHNVFTLQTSGVTEAELKISPKMVDLKKPLTVIANGKQIFKGMVKADKAYLLDNFAQSFDRAALWVNSIKVKID